MKLFSTNKETRTLDDILATFKQTKDNLISFIEEKHIRDAVITGEIAELQQEQEEVLIEKNKAQQVLTQIQNILGE